MNQSTHHPNEIFLSIGFLVSEAHSNEIHTLLEDHDIDPLLIPHTGGHFITLLSLGKIYQSTLQSLITIIENTASRIHPITCKNGRLLVMRPDEPDRLWIRYDSNSWYEKLVEELEESCWKIGTWRFTRDRKGRRASGAKISAPHITIAKTEEGTLLNSIVPPCDITERLSVLRLDTLCIFRRDRIAQGNISHTPLFSLTLK